MMTMMPTSLKTSPNAVTTPDVNRSFSTSTSEVTRVINRPDGIAVVEAQVEPLQVAVDGHPQVEHDPLPGQLHRPGLDVFGREADDQHRRKTTASRSRPDDRAGGDVAVDGGLDDVGLSQVGAAAGDDRDQREAAPAASTAASTGADGRISRASYALPRTSSSCIRESGNRVIG
jgi:hypothetical protein